VVGFEGWHGVTGWLLLTGGWVILGIPGNYLRVHGLTNGTGQCWTLLAMILWAAIAGVAANSVIRQQRRPADYGFSFKSGGVASLALLAVNHGYLVISGKFLLPATEGYLWNMFTISPGPFSCLRGFIASQTRDIWAGCGLQVYTA
jgi:hypothetical protein